MLFKDELSRDVSGTRYQGALSPPPVVDGILSRPVVAFLGFWTASERMATRFGRFRDEDQMILGVSKAAVRTGETLMTLTHVWYVFSLRYTQKAPEERAYSYVRLEGRMYAVRFWQFKTWCGCSWYYSRIYWIYNRSKYIYIYVSGFLGCPMIPEMIITKLIWGIWHHISFFLALLFETWILWDEFRLRHQIPESMRQKTAGKL